MECVLIIDDSGRPKKPPEEIRKTFELSKDIPVTAFQDNSKLANPPIEQLVSSGVVNLNKPMGPSSHQVSSWVKHIMGIEKVGHGGTLDPRVTGVLPLAFGKTASILYILTYSSKEYICVMRLHGDIPITKIKQIFQEFVGPIYQLPPVRSAVKRQIRIRTIYSIDILEHKKRDILLRVVCEAGTYIRSLVNDIGLILGKGAHMQELRRTRTGPFHEKDGISLHDLKDSIVFWQDEKDESLIRKYIKPWEVLLADLPKMIIHDTAVDAICHGADLAVPGIIQFHDIRRRGEPVAIFTRKGEGVAIGEAEMVTKDILKVETGIVLRTKRVIMQPGIYTKAWKKKKANV